ncbi:MAG TPA: hypothetical protein DIS90_03965, partial [Cytophagales bacterium]|nr:hypothetical protein [Cytophagales bacterium]
MKAVSLVISFVFVLSLSISTNAQVNSQNSGDWNNTNTWDCGCVPDFNSGVITIVGSTSVTIPNAYTADADQIVVAGDGILTIQNGGTLIVRDGVGTDLTVEEADFITTFSDGLVTVQSGGLLENRGSVSSNASNLIINSGGEYRHNRNSGVIPTASYQSGSTVRITGITSSAITGGLGQSFHHFIWDCPSQGATGGFLNGNITSIGGDFTINNTNNQFLILGYTAGSSTGSTTVSGNLSINGTSKFYISAVATYTLNVNGNFSVAGLPTGSNNFPFLGTASGTVTLNVAQNVSFSSARISRLVAASGSFTLNNTGTFTMTGASLEMTVGSGGSTINSTGTFSVSNGTIDMSGSSGTGTVNAFNNFTMASATLTETSTGSGAINFVGTGTHLFSKTGGLISNDINFVNASNSTLDLGTSILEGTGSFTNNGTLRVGSTHASGALQNTTILDSDCGNIILSGTRTYANPSIIVYNGSGAQILGDGHPTTAGVDITIANASGVSINAPTTLAGTINLTSGNLNVGASSLTITGGVSGPNFITVGPTGSLTLGGSSVIGTFPFAAGAHSFANFTLNNTNGVTFANDVTLSGTLTLTNGNLNFNNRTLTLNGTLSAGGGSFSGNASSTLAIGGGGAFGSLPLAGTIGTLTFDRSSGTASINGSLVVANTFNLLNGDFTNTNGLQMANGSLLRRKGASAQLLGNPPTNLPAGQFYNVAYSDVAGPGSGLTTGLELPNTSDDNLGSLTINSSASVILDKNIIVNGGVSLQAGTLSAGSNNITMNSVSGTWNKTIGTFDGGTGSVVIAGNITVTASSTPNFTNIIANSGSSLTFPSGNINISGDLQLNSGGTFVPNGGTIILNGSGNQTITGAGRTFTNLTVNKGGGNVSLLPTVNLTGILNILSATTVQSNGNLILISTSDAASGNAS